MLFWDAYAGFTAYSKNAAYAPQFDTFKFEGISSSVSPAQYETLHQEANDEWPAADFGTITITSPTTDTVEDPNNIVVSGRVSGGKKQARYLVYNINGADGLEGDVIALNQDGSFSFTIAQLPSANNSIMMYASDSECATVRRCAQPFAAFKEIKIKVHGESCFANLGFETGDWTGWDHMTYTWWDANPTRRRRAI